MDTDPLNQDVWLGVLGRGMKTKKTNAREEHELERR
jgi:hypothetical protein